MATRPPAHVYIDGFNFYYGVVKGTRYKWLNLQSLFCSIFTDLDIARIEYFTARVKPKPDDPNCHLRQHVYLEALSTLADFEIVEGTFSVKATTAPLLNATKISPGSTDITFPRVHILKSEEKGSDVSLGSRMVFEGCRGQYAVAVVASNDSDLLEPIRIVRAELGLEVRVLMPSTRQTRAHRGKKSVFEGKVDRVVASVNSSALSASQFPDQITGPNGPIMKPPSW